MCYVLCPQEYMSEGIGVELVDFSDNRPLLDMFLTKPLGMLALLDEESRFPRATDRTLVGKEAGSSVTLLPGRFVCTVVLVACLHDMCFACFISILLDGFGLFPDVIVMLTV